MEVEVIKSFFSKRRSYKPGDIIVVTRERAKRLAEQKLIKFKIVPVAHKMIIEPKEAK